METHALPRGQSFYLAYKELRWLQIEEWATTECRGFQEVDILKGLPLGWRFARISEATGDETIRGVFRSYLSLLAPASG